MVLRVLLAKELVTGVSRRSAKFHSSFRERRYCLKYSDRKFETDILDGSYAVCEEEKVMFTLLIATSPWELVRVSGHTCAKGGVDRLVTQSPCALANQEIRMG